jgi:hypothetical protein
MVSVVALAVSWSKDRKARKTEQADKVRSAAALVLTKIDRWMMLNLSLYQLLQPAFVKASEMLLHEFNVPRARDYLWKEINNQRSEIARQVLAEEILTCYVSLLPHFPKVRDDFVFLFQELSNIEDEISGSFLKISQDDILPFDKQEGGYRSALLGNALRKTAVKCKSDFREKTLSKSKPLREFLFNVIRKSDGEILNRKKR